jgi:diaminopimelate decarboxylase
MIRAEGDRLMIEGRAAGDLAGEFGTPLFVFSEETLRRNYREIHGAFGAAWPEPVHVLYALKANLSLALARVLADEGAGADVFTDGELHAALAAGIAGDKIALNGSLKPPDLVRQGLIAGAQLNVDVVEEVDLIARVAAELGVTARLGVRAKPSYEELERYQSVPSPYRHGRHVGLGTWIADNKWGLTVDEAVEVVRVAQQDERVDLAGVHTHVGRHYAEQGMFDAAVPGLVRWLAGVRDATSWAPRRLDLGGGFAHDRDPLFLGSAGVPEQRITPIAEVAASLCATLRSALESAGLPLPELELEPGRFLVTSAGVLLATVGPIKRQGELGTWVNVDASVAHFPGPEMTENRHEVVLVERASAPEGERQAIVGPSCWEDLLAYDQRLPALAPGDVIAFLDAGAYAESYGGNVNAIGRPANVLVSGAIAEEIKRRETVQDVFARDLIPARLRGASAQ